HHVVGGVSPAGGRLEVGAELGGVAWMAGDGVGGSAQIQLCEQIGVDVVVCDRAVLVGSGDAVDTEAAERVVVAERTPEPGRLDKELESDLALEVLVLRRVLVAHDRIRDVCADVETCGAGRPVAGALVAADRAPGKGGSLERQLTGALPGQVEGGVSPAERVGGGARRGVGKHREDESLRVPEGVAVVAGTRETFAGNCALLGAGACLEGV